MPNDSLNEPVSESVKESVKKSTASHAISTGTLRFKAFTSTLWTAFVCTLVLVGLGGVVHNTGSSLACPDWPLCFGQVMPEMTGAVGIEHSHRLLATLVGFFCVVLVVLSFPLRKVPGWKRLFRWSCVALGLVIFQGVLGGITVLLRLSPIVSTLHLGSSQIFLAVLLSLGMITMSWAGDSWKTKDVSPWLKVSVVALFVQMLLGAFIRHGGAAVACGLGTEALFLCVNPETQSRGLWSPFAEGQTHMLHRYGAIVVSVLILVSTIHCIRWAKKEGRRDLRILSVLTHGLLVLQVVIGLWTVGSGIAAWPVSLHLIFGMLLWLTMLALHHRTASQLPLMWPRGAPQHERREAFSV